MHYLNAHYSLHTKDKNDRQENTVHVSVYIHLYITHTFKYIKCILQHTSACDCPLQVLLLSEMTCQPD